MDTEPLSRIITDFLDRTPDRGTKKFRELLLRPDLDVHKLADAVEVIDLWDGLRNIDCVKVDACYAPHGTTHFTTVGEDKGKLTVSADSLLAALRKAFQGI